MFDFNKVFGTGVSYQKLEKREEVEELCKRRVRGQAEIREKFFVSKETQDKFDEYLS